MRGALGFAEQARARTLLDTVQQKRKRVTSEMSAEEVDREEALDLELRFADVELSAAINSKKPDRRVVEACRERLRVARERLEAFQKELYKTKPDLEARRGLAEWRPTSPPAMPTGDTAILEYAFIGSTPDVFVVRKGDSDLTASRHPLGGTSAEISEAVRTFVDLLGHRRRGFGDA